ncbi:nucleoside/nucleotide kinase family protein [Microbacterium sp. A8/3-1]|uniref:Nucleoside/nucleotide kinase family protein n=1 Tax=Microbacterium sp. A8/3-1 TaxID=3160749 RepID=A0AAU7W3I8_9MICO
MSTNSPSTTAPVSESVAALVRRARALSALGGRRILGITGAPGAGKSTLCAALIAALGDSAVLVGMDGFHLANNELNRLGRRERKGAPDTFDVGGYVHLLARLSAQTEGTIYAPVFDRSLEESIGGAVGISASVPLVITEGNYLLHGTHGWDAVAENLDEIWYLDEPADVLEERLVLRRRAHGDSIEAATAWVRDVDLANAHLVEQCRDRADLIVHVTQTSDLPNPAASPTTDERVAR